MGFLVQIDPFTFPAERRYFVAEREGKVLAFLGIIARLLATYSQNWRPWNVKHLPFGAIGLFTAGGVIGSTGDATAASFARCSRARSA